MRRELLSIRWQAGYQEEGEAQARGGFAQDVVNCLNAVKLFQFGDDRERFLLNATHSHLHGETP